ncbi:MAG TPA: LapA family protein [Prolixibacteraceae bacterium]|nr:LapA family protein [Prolixibacteraceae bacterium]
MSGKVIVFFVFSVLLVIFTFQNQLLIDIRFFKWELTEVPLVMVLIAGLIFGFLLAMMLQLPTIIRLKRELKKVINELENDYAVAVSDEEITSDGISMGKDYKGGFFNE